MDHADTGETSPSTMIIRVWNEPGHEHGFRARLTSDPGGGGEPQMSVIADPENVLESVRTWLAKFTGSETAQTTPPSQL